MAIQSSNTTTLNRRRMFAASAALAVAGVSPALALPAASQDAKGDEARIELLTKLHQVLGRALADSRLHIVTTNRKKLAGNFTVRLEGDDYIQFMSAILAGVVFAGLQTPDEIVAKLESNMGQPKS